MFYDRSRELPSGSLAQESSGQLRNPDHLNSVCTATWWSDGSCYELFFNRDELKTRPPALAPKIIASQQLKFIAPTDPSAGGTWIAVNQAGLSLALLNHTTHPDEPETPSPAQTKRSRGLLVRELAPCQHISAVGRALDRLTLSAYSAFHLLAITPHPFQAVLWTHHPHHPRQETRFPSQPVSSSSFQSTEVIAKRKKTFRDQLHAPLPEQLKSFHLHAPPHSAYTVFMQRPDAQTWSFNHIQVDHQTIRFHYLGFTLNHADPPQETLLSLPLVLSQ